MELAERVVEGHTIKSGIVEFTATAGQHVKLESMPDGEEAFDFVVPPGKSWEEITVTVEVKETDL